ncbi:MAG TPA: energy transducer TonB [Steroidobacteraceae bacterium]|jgi:protein TonB|nr:energy transducer TonB [Steroidobacteraceae bacterium]
MARRALMLREGRAPVWDRLLTMLFLAGLLHGLIILGLTFNASAGDKGSAPGLEVLLVSDELPESDRNDSATYLAQRTQVGSGNTQQSVAPRNRAAAVPVPHHAGTPDGDSLADAGDAAASPDERVLTTTAWNTQVRYLGEDGSSAALHSRPLLLDQPPVAQPGPEDEAGPATLKGPQREELWVTPDTRAATLAPYLDAWRRKVERIGTLNYPTVARIAGGAASPVVEVGIGADGALDRAVISRSSGNAELDQAALEILKLASPFDPFPPELSAHYHVLRFAYEWQFVGGRVATGKLSTVP